MLRQVPLFSTAPMSAVRLLADRSIHRQVAQHHEVVREGHPGDALFIVQKGALRVHRGDTVLAELAEGQFMGEMALLTGEPRNATVTASEDTLLLRVPVQALFEAITKLDGLAAHLINTAIERGLTTDQLPTVEKLTELARIALEETARASTHHEYGINLASIPLFSKLSNIDRKQILGACDLFRRGPKAKLVTQGTIGPGLCLILSGEAKVTHDGREVATLIDGDLFGEINLLTGWLATATVSSLSPMALALLQWGDLYTILARNPKLGWQLLRILSRRTDQLEQTLKHVEDTRPSIVMRLSQKVQRLLEAPVPVSNDIARNIQAAFSDLREIPNSATETLASFATEVATINDLPEDRDRGYLLTKTGRVFGLTELFDENPIPLLERQGREGSDMSGWHLTKAHTYDCIARCPHVLRFLSRAIVRNHIR